MTQQLGELVCNEQVTFWPDITGKLVNRMAMLLFRLLNVVHTVFNYNLNNKYIMEFTHFLEYKLSAGRIHGRDVVLNCI